MNQYNSIEKVAPQAQRSNYIAPVVVGSGACRRPIQIVAPAALKRFSQIDSRDTSGGGAMFVFSKFTDISR
ncbi:MAG: hypothetical protein K9K30_08700 [Burkholderiaceae bacterium]|nr:hypothetical protein [Sulfuritalea sp.]MCF8175303.1 hypothetical protein [Burkholderiaceae bacterium]